MRRPGSKWQVRRVLAVTLVGVATTALGVGCGASGSGGSGNGGSQASFLTGGTPGGTPVRGGRAVIDSAEAPKSLDPVVDVAEPGDERASTEMFDTLFEVMPGSNEPQPALAASWSVSKDHLTYIFHIREGVKFSNGDPLTGEDVIYSLRRDQKLPESGGAPYTAKWKGLSLVDPMTVKLELKEPEPQTIEALSAPAFGIVDKKVAGHESESAFAQHPVGTGPFMLKSTTPGNTTVTMVRNPHFWRPGKPYLDELVLNQVESENARILAVKTGTATVAAGIPYSQVASLMSTPGAKMVIEPEWGSAINPINNTKPPLNEVNVRRALMYATPIKEIIKAVYKGYGTQANSVGAGLQKYTDPNVPTYPYDIAKAKALLKSTSVPNGFPVTITVQGGESSGELIGSILQSAWAKIGVRVSVHSVDAATIATAVFAGKFEVIILPPEGGLAEGYDSGLDYYVYNDGTFFPAEQPSARTKAKIAKVNVAWDPATRERLIHELQEEVYLKEPTWIPTINLATFNLVSDSLHNFNDLPNGHTRMEEAWLAH
jgi:peptide/nickel transport system substrate-binding protein